MILRDATRNRKSLTFQLGNKIRSKGHVALNEYDYPVANCHTLEFLSAGSPPAITNISAVSELKALSFDDKLVRVHGIVKEAFRDEIDPKYVYLTLDNHGALFTVSVCDDMEHDDFINSLIDAEISTTGIYSTMKMGLRKILDWTLTTYGTNNICILTPAPKDPFDVPSLSDANPSTPSDVAALGRRKTTGLVTAVRKGRDFLIADDHGTTRRIKPRNADFPAFGDIVEAVGNPETDLYRLNLGDALWRKTGEKDAPLDTSAVINVERILTDGKGNFKINPLFHGKTIHIIGSVIDIPNRAKQIETLTLKCGVFSIPVDISTLPDLESTLSIGCRLDISGTCIVETDNWRPYPTFFPHSTGITLVVRKPEDVTIISQPPWWTPAKFLTVVTSILLALVAFIVWNRMLNKLVAKKSRALIKEQLALAEAELKIDERTRLAIELHDSLSQNLAAVACQVAATKGAVRVGVDETMENLNATERMLLSCRTELRRCLWDLRSDALDEKNMSDVVRKVLGPVLCDAELHVRFNVPRSRLDDSTAHAASCVIRELTSNAVRHGHATHITVAGDLKDGILAFSVRDNGDGFDPDRCQGPEDGHFGLAGIRERIERFRGSFTIHSAAGKGTDARARMQLPSYNTEGDAK